jgi:hypothetical protein
VSARDPLQAGLSTHNGEGDMDPSDGLYNMQVDSPSG